MCEVNGGIAAIGLLFGRDEKRGPKDQEAIKCMELTKELRSWFEANNGKHATCCRVLTREFNMAEGEHKKQCVNVCSEVFRWEPVILAKAEVYSEITDATKEKVENAAKVCQTQAIILE